MRVVVIGGAGFIGCHTVERLLAEGHDVVVLDSLDEKVHPGGVARWLNKRARLVRGDVRDANALSDVLKGAEVVFHFAAYQDYMPDFSNFFSVNTVGTALLFQVIVEKKLPLKRVVVASSQAVYGEGRYRCGRDGTVFPPGRSERQLQRGEWDLRCPLCGGEIAPEPSHEKDANPRNQYALSKYSQELLALRLGERYDIPTVALRYSIVQGPKQSFHNAYSGVCRIFCLAGLAGRRPVIYEDGRQLRDYVNIEDVVDANMLAMHHDGAVNQVLNVGGGRTYTVLDFAEIVSKHLGRDLNPKIPGIYRVGDVRHVFSDISRLRALGWEPRHTPEKSVRDYLDWLHEEGTDAEALARATEAMKRAGVLKKAGAVGEDSDG